MYESNYPILCDIVADRSALRHVSRHRNPDGSVNYTRIEVV